MPRTVPPLLAADLQTGVTTLCQLLRVAPKQAATFGMTTLDADVTYDDGNGAVLYQAANGYDAFDVDAKNDLTVNNSQADALLSPVYNVGMTADGIARGDYDDASFVVYLVNYAALSHGAVILQSGRIGQVKMLNDMTCQIELRSLVDVLKQNNLIGLTSITDRAMLGDDHNKLSLYWYASSVATVGTETDRIFTCANAPGSSDAPGGTTGAVSGVPLGQGNGTSTTAQLKDTAGNLITSGFTVTAVKLNGTALAGPDYSVSGTGLITFTTAPASGAQITWDGTLTLRPDGYFAPGVVHFDTGANAGIEREVESYVAATGTVTLAIPVPFAVQAGDTFRIRRDYDQSWAMATGELNNGNNFRGEPYLPRGNATDIQAPTPQST